MESQICRLYCNTPEFGVLDEYFISIDSSLVVVWLNKKTFDWTERINKIR
jgi:hypothetical protein